MDTQRLIVILAIAGIGFWFYKSYEPEINEKINNAQDAEIDPFLKAEGFFHGFKYEQAIELYRTAIGRGLAEPKKQEAYFRIAVSLDKMNQKREALAAYQEAIKLYPNTNNAERAKGTVERLRVETGQ